MFSSSRFIQRSAASSSVNPISKAWNPLLLAGLAGRGGSSMNMSPTPTYSMLPCGGGSPRAQSRPIFLKRVTLKPISFLVEIVEGFLFQVFPGFAGVVGMHEEGIFFGAPVQLLEHSWHVFIVETVRVDIDRLSAADIQVHGELDDAVVVSGRRQLGCDFLEHDGVPFSVSTS